LNEQLIDLLAENVTKITQINAEVFFDLGRTLNYNPVKLLFFNIILLLKVHCAIKNYSNYSRISLASFIPGILNYTAVLSVEESFCQTIKMKKRLQDILSEVELKLKVLFTILVKSVFHSSK